MCVCSQITTLHELLPLAFELLSAFIYHFAAKEANQYSNIQIILHEY